MMGIFAGRGDVILAMGLTLVIGFYLGWQARKIYDWTKNKCQKKHQQN